MTKPFSHAERNVIRKDWQAILPDMAFKPKTTAVLFDRIVGPLKINVGLGLTIGAGWKRYRPRYSIHNLARQIDYLTGQICNTRRVFVIDADKHKERYIDVATSLKEDAWIHVDGPITLDDIFNGYSNAAKDKMSHYQDDYERSLEGLTKTFKRLGKDEKRAKDKLDYGSLTLHEAPTPALVAAWAGEPQKAKEYLDWAYKVAGWEADEMLEIYAPLIEQPELLRATARTEHIKHGLTYAPCQNIIGVPYQETWSD